MTDKPRCPFCGGLLIKAEVFCRWCGRELALAPLPVATIELDRRRYEFTAREKRFAKVFAALLICGVLYGLMSLVFSSDPSKPETSAAADSPPTGFPLSGNLAHDRLYNLPVDSQAGVLGKATGDGCIGQRAFYMGMDKNLSAYWSVACAGGKSYEVRLNADPQGSTDVVDCAVLRQVKVKCFESLSTR